MGAKKGAEDSHDLEKKDAGMRLIVCEDNEAVIKIVSKQRSMALRHVSRTHRVCLDWTFEILQSDTVSMRYVNTKYQIADMMTKAFTKKDAWQYLLDLSAITKPINEKKKVNVTNDKNACIAYSLIVLHDTEGNNTLCKKESSLKGRRCKPNQPSEKT